MSPIVQRLVKFAQQARTLSTRYLHAAARPSVSEIETLHEKLSDTVTPLWRLPYSEQLKKKYDQNYRVLQALTRAASKNKSHKSGQLICPLEDVVPSPVIIEYRNKEEFHVKYDQKGEPIVGMLLGKASQENLVCVPPDRLINTRKSHAAAAKVFQDYVKTSSWKVCEHFQKGGHWRRLMVRSNLKNELMVVAIIHPQNLKPDEISEEMQRFTDFILQSNIENLKSIYYQACPHTRCSSEQAPFQLLHGQAHLHETINRHSFRISPESFFQVNTAAAQTMYEQVARLLAPDLQTTLLDICCGTGTQGILVADRFRSVIGIEVSRQAIQDARHNSALNKIHNTEFYPGRVEEHLDRILCDLDRAVSISAIINPSRGGVQSSVIDSLRDNERIRRIVYVSCQPQGPAANNMTRLMRRGDRPAFQLTSAVPVDMFPHTDHCELILQFQR